jgi:hypothetical protein
VEAILVRTLFVAVSLALAPRPGVADPGKNVGPVPAPAEPDGLPRR